MPSDRAIRVWCNQPFVAAIEAKLRQGLTGYELIYAPGVNGPNPELEAAQIVFGQPAPPSLLKSDALRWAHVSSAGYTPWDRQDLFERFRERGAALTRSSMVYSEPCAEHILAFMLAWARRLPLAHDDQRGAKSWRYRELRDHSRLLLGQKAVLFGYGSIGARLVELLHPFRMSLIGVRERAHGDEPIPTLSIDDPALQAHLGAADHVIDLLPLNASTQHAFNATRLRAIRKGAVFYNIGRGSTVDQSVLLELLQARHLSAAWLDVTETEPLPPEHPLWTVPNCYITPHSGGGHDNEQERLVDHFLENLKRFERDDALLDRVV